MLYIGFQDATTGHAIRSIPAFFFALIGLYERVRAERKRVAR